MAPAADLDGGPDALVGVGGRHADVDDGHVGRLPLDALQQLVGPADRRHVVALVGEDAGQPLTEDDGILRDHDAQGITARTVVPAPGGLTSSNRPLTASTRSTNPRRPEPRP